MLSFDEFKKMEIKSARILEVKEHPEADRLYIVDIDLGDEKRQIVAGIRAHYSPDDLIGRNIAVVTNLKPAVIRGVESNGMLLAGSDDNTISILTFDKDLAPGSVIK